MNKLNTTRATILISKKLPKIKDAHHIQELTKEFIEAYGHRWKKSYYAGEKTPSVHKEMKNDVDLFACNRHDRLSKYLA